jgi:hypothetical protein
MRHKCVTNARNRASKQSECRCHAGRGRFVLPIQGCESTPSIYIRFAIVRDYISGSHGNRHRHCGAEQHGGPGVTCAEKWSGGCQHYPTLSPEDAAKIMAACRSAGAGKSFFHPLLHSR